MSLPILARNRGGAFAAATGGGAVAKTLEDEIADGDLTAGVPTMWMDAGAGISDTGGLVDSWTSRDESAITFVGTATGSNRPTTTTASGVPVIDFDGSDDTLNFSSGDFSASALEYSIFVALSNDETTLTNGVEIVDFAGTSSRFLIKEISSNRFAFYIEVVGATVPQSYLTPDPAMPDKIVLGFVSNDTANEVKYYENGNNYETDTSLSDGTLKLNLTCGLSDRSGYRFNGKMYHILVFASKLDDTDREKVEGFLAQEMGITDRLPEGHTYKDT
tara:strand:+ start:52 stop:876 length:825 start_codon:yes stop_codon:yes gene_type:complete